MESSIAHITVDGHGFYCDHSKNIPHHVVFVIDKPSSMSSLDIKPTMAKFISRHNCRLGCAYEAIVRFITTRHNTSSDDSLFMVLFVNTTIVALEMQEMKEDKVDSLIQYVTAGGTSYYFRLKLVEEVIYRESKHPSVVKKKPTIMFFNDGGNDDGRDPLEFVNRLNTIEPGPMHDNCMSRINDGSRHETRKYIPDDRFITTRHRTSSDDSLFVVLFDNTTIVALEMQKMKEDRVDSLIQYVVATGTNYSCGPKLAEEVIYQESKHPNVVKKKPTIIFLSDGGNNNGRDPLEFVNRLNMIVTGPMHDNCTIRIYDGSGHEIRKYGPDEDVPKDELTHETYWKKMWFEDPCTEEYEKAFSPCNHLCRSKEHNEIDVVPRGLIAQRNYGMLH